MKIAFVYPYPLPIQDQKPVLPQGVASGGGEVYPFALARAFARKGHQVDYYTGKLPGITKEYLKIDQNLNVYYLPVWGANSIMKTFSWALIKNLFINRYDFVNANQLPLLFTFIAGLVSKLRGATFVVSHHGFNPRFNSKSKILAKVNSIFVDHVVVQNEFAKNLYLGIIPDRKVVTIPNGIDLDVYKEVEVSQELRNKYQNVKTIGYLGRLLPSKGLNILIDAFSRVHQEIPQTKLLIGGTGSFKEYLENQVSELKLEDAVEFLGFVPDEVVNEYYSLFDTFVLPSVYDDVFGNHHTEPEAFGLVLGEAMACNTPVIASSVGGVPAWISDGENGLLFESGDSDHLTTNLLKLLTNQEYSQTLARQAYKILEEKYSMDYVISRYLEFL